MTVYIQNHSLITLSAPPAPTALRWGRRYSPGVQNWVLWITPMFSKELSHHQFFPKS